MTEGEINPPELFAQGFGIYATPIEIGVVCAEVIAVGVPPGADTSSSTDTLEHAITTLHLFVCSHPWQRLCSLKWKLTGVHRCWDP